ncbi:Galanin [Beggiatoa sp. PS]|nr:Galanin [Beggiatoa sp. PS]
MDRWTGEDYIEGNFGQTMVKFSEIHLQKESDDSFYTLFDGLFSLFIFPNLLKVLSWYYPMMLNDDKDDFIGGYANKPIATPVKLATPELEQAFLVYSNNPMMAGYTLSTNFLSHLLTWHHRLKKPIFLSFVNDKLYMAINVETDLFEPPVFHTVLNFRLIQQFFENIQFGKTMVTDLRQSLKEPTIT